MPAAMPSCELQVEDNQTVSSVGPAHVPSAVARGTCSKPLSSGYRGISDFRVLRHGPARLEHEPPKFFKAGAVDIGLEINPVPGGAAVEDSRVDQGGQLALERRRLSP